MHIFTAVIVILAAVFGWLLGRTSDRKNKKNTPETLSQDYFIGLNYLLNEEPDRAVDVFIQMLEVDDQTVETHLALGSLFRRRGEVERAIRIHQNLIARPNLSKRLRIQSLVELGRDYMSAGVLDRAERLFLEAIETGGPHRLISLQFLREIYEREKDWFAAVDVAEQIQRLAGEDMGQQLAQYYCEIIEDPRQNLSLQQSIDYLRNGLQADRNSTRVSLLKAKQVSEEGDYKEAIKLYKRVLKQEPSFIPVVLPLLEQVYQPLGDDKAYVNFLYKSLDEIHHPLLVVAIARKLQEWHGVESALSFLQERLQESPSLVGLEYLMTLQSQFLSGDNQNNMQLAEAMVQTLLRQQPHYQCEHCGFVGRKLHWLCPSCHRWGSIKPVLDFAKEK